MSKDAYTLHKEIFKWYIIPCGSHQVEYLPHPNSFLSFWFKKNAEITLNAMNAAFREGCRYNSYFKEK